MGYGYVYFASISWSGLTKGIRLIADPSLKFTSQSLACRRTVASLSIFYHYYFGFCSSEHASTVPLLVTFSNPSRTYTQLVNFISVNRCCALFFQCSLSLRLQFSLIENRINLLVLTWIFPSIPPLETFDYQIYPLYCISRCVMKRPMRVSVVNPVISTSVTQRPIVDQKHVRLTDLPRACEAHSNRLW